jgi:hypothetical protein
MDELAKTEKHTEAEIKLIHDMFAKNTTAEEFKLFLYTANRFGLDPMLKQIWCVKFGNSPASIYAGRDGFLEVAHRSGGFNGMESGMKNDRTAFCKVYRKDMQFPFTVEVDLSEYSTGQALWKSKPKTMLIKVAESQALRKAFSISGIYSPEEMGQWELEAQGIKYNKEQPAITETGNDFSWDKMDLSKIPKWGGSVDKPLAPPIVKRLFAIQKQYGVPADEFKTLCLNITEKQHSNEWTYGDIKDIEYALELLHKKGTKEIKEVEVIEAEPETEEQIQQGFEEAV